jgi:hypothetical protein
MRTALGFFQTGFFAVFRLAVLRFAVLRFAFFFTYFFRHAADPNFKAMLFSSAPKSSSWSN